jgi:tripartite-type tricarboxylate transporter receptor subunit TctC
MTEEGYAQIEANQWVGLLVPAGAPKDIVISLNREIVRSIALAETRANLAALGFEPMASTQEDMGKQIKVEAEIWGNVIRAANIKAR